MHVADVLQHSEMMGPGEERPSATAAIMKVSVPIQTKNPFTSTEIC
jgi:hypothetical protein